MLTCKLSVCVSILTVFTTVASVVVPPVAADDWPTWRHDAERSGASSDALPTELHLAWWRDDAAPQLAWPEDERLNFDAVHEPIVVGKTLFYGSTRTDSVVALDTNTGSLKWRFMVGGPVRFAPVAHGGRVYFGSDDSFFYAVNAADGQLIWKFRAAPSERKVIGNDRLISVWPIRGGPVVTGDTLRFTAGVWPIEGTFLFTVDLAKSIDVAEYTAFSLPEIVPQGYLAQSGARLLIPGGRAPVTAYDVEKRKFIEYDYRSRGLTDFHVAAKGRYLFHGDRVFDCDTEELIDLPVGRPVTGSDSEFLFFASAQKIQAANLGKPKEVETKDRRGKPIKKRLFETSWELSSDQILAVLNDTEDRRSPKYRYELDDELTIDVRAGNRIYGRSGDVVFGIELPHEDQAAKVTWAKAVKGTPGTMIAADDKLFIATREGRIYCYSGDQGHPRIHEAPEQPRRLPVAARKPDLDLGLSMVGVDQGFALIWGLSDEGDRAYNALRRILHESDLRVVAVDPNKERVQRLRTRLTDEGFYGERLELRVGNPADYNWPPYLASVVLSDDLADAGWSEGVGFVTELFRTLRPYGGAACLRLSDAEHQEMSKWVAAAKLSNGEVTRDGDYSILRRVGTLAGTANWEHEYGDPANTLTSPDTLVKPPLGLLWFGGPSSNGDLYYDRHRWPPSMAVVDGRIFLQGPEKLTAVDVYTGRILWQIPIATGLSPGRRGWISVTGFHFVAIPDGIYLTYERSCVRLDPATGKQLSEFRLPNADDHWGRVRIVGDRLIVPVFRPVDDSVARGYVSGWRDDRGPPGSGRLAKRIAVLDRNDGRLLWEREADHGVLMLSVSSNRVFCFDGILKDFFRSEDRKGIDPSSKKQLSLKVWDINTGEQIWKKETLMAMTWLAYSEEHDVLVASNKNGVEAWRGNNGERLWRKNNIGYGFKGHPESVWNKVIVRKNQVIDQRGPGKFYDLLTGRAIKNAHPVTGEEVDWEFTKVGHHCNYAIANEHLMTFRAATGGFFDLATSGTGRLNGFRTGCRNSLVPACGVLNAPNFAHGCNCDYSLFTSLSFVHVPENEQWTYNAFTATGERVKQVGVNFGAPGDRLAPNGTLWLDYPSVGGPSPKIDVAVAPEESHSYRRHSAQLAGEGLAWVAASGVEGASTVTVPLVPLSATETETDGGAATTPSPTLEETPTAEPKPHTVRLYFSEPLYRKAGKRVFNVSIAGKQVLKNLDIFKDSGGTDRVLIREFRDVTLADELKISLTPVRGETLLSGIEVLAQ